jgi:cell division protease FtsH
VQILGVHLKKIRLGPDVDADKIAAITTGFSGADLATLVNEAALVATRRDAEAVTLDDFNRAVERIVAGLEKKNRVLSPKEREIVAYHEMGHALVALALPGTDVVHKVSVIPRGVGALGYTIQRPTEDRYLMQRGELTDKVAVLLGGRAAEVLVFGSLSTGAADDLAKASDIARDMATRYGMEESLGQVVYQQEAPRFLEQPTGAARPGLQVSEHTAEAIDEAVRGTVACAFDTASAVLRANRAVLDRCARELLERETLEEDRLRELTQGLVRPGPDTPAGRPVAGRPAQAVRAGGGPA